MIHRWWYRRSVHVVTLAHPRHRALRKGKLNGMFYLWKSVRFGRQIKKIYLHLTAYLHGTICPMRFWPWRMWSNKYAYKCQVSNFATDEWAKNVASALVVIRQSDNHKACGIEVKCWYFSSVSLYWKIARDGNRTRTFGLLVQCSTNWATRSSRFECVIYFTTRSIVASISIKYIHLIITRSVTHSNRLDLAAQLVEHRSSSHVSLATLVL